MLQQIHCIPLYPTVSRCFCTHLAVSSCISPYLTVSHRIENGIWPKNTLQGRAPASTHPPPPPPPPITHTGVCMLFLLHCRRLCIIPPPVFCYTGRSRLGPYKILPIFYCNKGSRGENILRNIVGNKGCLGGGGYTIMCNNAPFPRRERIFFSDTSIHIRSI